MFLPNILNWFTVRKVIRKITRSSAIAERLRCRVVSFGQKWKTGNERQYFADNIGLSSTTSDGQQLTTF